MRIQFLPLLLSLLTFQSCDYFILKDKYDNKDVNEEAIAAKVYDEVLLNDHIDWVKNDSGVLLKKFKKDWIDKQLLYYAALKEIDINDPIIEFKTREYKKDLVVQQYLDGLSNTVSKNISESEINSFYEKHKEEFVCRNGIAQATQEII